jgi:hypothetical protein
MNLRPLVLPLVLLVSVILGACSSEPTSSGGNVDTTGSYYVRTLTGIEISAQASTVSGNLYDVEADSLYPMYRYSSKKSLIDFIYYYASSNGDLAAIVSPDYDVLSNGSVSGNYSGYITDADRIGANSTEFRKLPTLSATQFDAIKDSASFHAGLSLSNGVGSTNRAKGLAVGDVYEFMTSNGTSGLFKVSDISSQSAAGTITIVVKTKK